MPLTGCYGAMVKGYNNERLLIANCGTKDEMDLLVRFGRSSALNKKNPYNQRLCRQA